MHLTPRGRRVIAAARITAEALAGVAIIAALILGTMGAAIALHDQWVA